MTEGYSWCPNPNCRVEGYHTHGVVKDSDGNWRLTTFRPGNFRTPDIGYKAVFHPSVYHEHDHGVESPAVIDGGAPVVGGLDSVQSEQVVRMDTWLRKADRVNYLDAEREGMGGSTGFDGVVVSSQSLSKEDKKWQQQASMTRGTTRIWSLLSRNFRRIAQKIGLQSE